MSAPSNGAERDAFAPLQACVPEECAEGLRDRLRDPQIVQRTADGLASWASWGARFEKALCLTKLERWVLMNGAQREDESAMAFFRTFQQDPARILRHAPQPLVSKIMGCLNCTKVAPAASRPADLAACGAHLGELVADPAVVKTTGDPNMDWNEWGVRFEAVLGITKQERWALMQGAQRRADTASQFFRSFQADPVAVLSGVPDVALVAKVIKNAGCALPTDGLFPVA